MHKQAPVPDGSPQTPASRYHRYHVAATNSPDVGPSPRRFNVKVSRPRLAGHLVTEILKEHNKAVITSRPCVYGVFSGPIGGFAPRPDKCVGCLRCMTEYPKMVRVTPNPGREELGDSYLTPDQVDTLLYEARQGRVAVKGAGFRGRFGGDGWDGMWTDMSEIVRPTRDGIHGREFISTTVDIGAKPMHLTFRPDGTPVGDVPVTISLPIPFLFDTPAVPEVSSPEPVFPILEQAAAALETRAIERVSDYHLHPHAIPLMDDEFNVSGFKPGYHPPVVEVVGIEVWQAAREYLQASLAILRLPLGEDLLPHFEKGVRVFHLEADYHGRGKDGRFALDLIRDAHKSLVDARVREQVTLIGSGGIVQAEHVPKAIICGLDVVAIDTALMVALQADLGGECVSRETSKASLPREVTVEWGVQRITNLISSWRDQLLEVLGAMGIREVRRLRGESGRAMFQPDLEREAFGEIEGFDG